jgi:hypothetical protein
MGRTTEKLEKWQQAEWHCQNDQDRSDNAGRQVLSPTLYPPMKIKAELKSKSVTAPPATNQPAAENADNFTSQHGC